MERVRGKLGISGKGGVYVGWERKRKGRKKGGGGGLFTFLRNVASEGAKYSKYSCDSPCTNYVFTHVANRFVTIKLQI